MFEQVMFFLAEVPPTHYPEQPEVSGTRSGCIRPRVLVVDDERLIASTVTAILNANGFEAVEAYSGDEALGKARSFQPDIVLSDVLMPRMSGVELGIQMHNEFPEARIVLFSGQAATSELMRKAKQDGYSFELLPKPIHPEDLVNRLRTI